MRGATYTMLARAAVLVALAASAALFLHYVNPADGAFCGAESGCEDVRRSKLAYFGASFLNFGASFLNLPLVGIVAFGTLLVLSLTRSRLFAPLASVGAALALALVGVQTVLIEAYCWLCLVVDVAGVAAGAFALLASRAPDAPDPLSRSAWLTIAGVAVAAPIVWPIVRPVPDVPTGIRARYVAGKINVVEFADFACPFCRRLHPVLAKLVRERAGRVNFVRLNMPLAQHPQAEDAARAAVCGEAQGKADAIADALFESEQVDAATNRSLAKRLGLDLEAFDRCVDDARTSERIEAEARILRDAGFLGLPTTYIGSTRIVGMRDEAVFREAMDRAERGDAGGGVPLPAYAALVALALGGIGWFGRARPVTRR